MRVTLMFIGILYKNGGLDLQCIDAEIWDFVLGYHCIVIV